MDNSEKLETMGIQEEETQNQTHNTENNKS